MTAMAAEVLAGELFRWNTPGDPYFVISGRAGDACVEDPYLPIARAMLAAVASGAVPGVVVPSAKGTDDA